MDVKQGISSIIAAKKSIPLVNTPKDVLTVGEIISERTTHAKVFSTGIPGQRTAKIYSAPIHWEDKDGSFKTIDTSIKRKPLADALQTHQYEAKTGLYHAHFKADKPHDYRMEIGESFVEYEALFEESASLSVKVETIPTGVKETITLVDEKAPTSLSWKVSKSGNGIVMLPPTAKDAKGKEVPVKVTEEKGILTYDVDVTGAVYPIVVDPTSVTTSTNDGDAFSSNASYSTARNATTGAGVATTRMAIGQGTEAFSIYRGFASFAIPNYTSIISASLFLYGRFDQSATDFDIYIHTSTYSNPLVKEDFDLFDGHQSSGAYNGTVLNNTWNTSSYSSTWNEITFNSSGISAILAKANDTLKIAIISKEDYDNSEPSGAEYVGFQTHLESGKEPYLSITYSVVVAPTVTTQDASDVAVTSCTGNGNITATGGANCTRRGFCYKAGTSGDPTTADSVAYDDGDYGTGAYTKSITGLSDGTGYRVRAYAVNSAGTSYGSTVQVTTPYIRTMSGVASGVFSASMALTLGTIEFLSGIISGVLSASLIFKSYKDVSGTALGDLSASLSIKSIKPLSGIATGDLSASMVLTLGAIELMSGVASGVLSASMVFTFFKLMSGTVEGEVSTRGRIVTTADQRGIITRY